MDKIKRFIINGSTASLAIVFNRIDQDDAKTIELSFEYLRVFAPTDDKGQATGFTPKVYHKKQVQLIKIESVAKYGYRFIFDDGHSNIYSSEYLTVLATEYESRWQHYLQSANTAINSREATIEIKEVK
jgi:DUF971 family protein